MLNCINYIFHVFYSSLIGYDKNFKKNLKYFAAPFELKELPELFWKQFVGADRSATAPTNQFLGAGPPLEIDL